MDGLKGLIVLSIKTYLIFLIVFFSSCSNSDSRKVQDSKGLVGEWVYLGNSKDVDFSLEIKKMGDDSLIGQHCFISRKGKRIECEKNENTIHLSKDNEGKFVGSFESSYTSKNYNLKIFIKNDTLNFCIEKNKGALFYDEDLKFVRK